MRTMTKFPNYDIRDYSIETNVRKKYRGKWYLMLVRNTSVIPLTQVDIYRFMEQVYLAILFGKVSIDATDFYGNPIFTLDSDQRSEEERLIPTYIKL